VIAAANPGCALQIGTYVEEAGRRVAVVHPVELVDAAVKAGAS